MARQRNLFDALDQPDPPASVIDGFDPFAPLPVTIIPLPAEKGQTRAVIPVAEFREMIKKPKGKPKEKKSDYDKWAALQSVSKITPEGFHVISGNIPAKSNSYKIITIQGKPQDCPACAASGKVVDYCIECHGTGKVPGRVHSSLGKTADLKSYEKQFFVQSGGVRDKMIAQDFEFHGTVYFPTRRSDLDNSFKIVLDCLQICRAIKNDNQCVHINVRKAIDKENPRIEFKIIPI